MDRFQAGEVDVLVSTTVIEVGVDVPNATVMLIEDATASASPAPPAQGPGRARRLAVHPVRRP